MCHLHECEYFGLNRSTKFTVVAVENTKFLTISYLSLNEVLIDKPHIMIQIVANVNERNQKFLQERKSLTIFL